MQVLEAGQRFKRYRIQHRLGSSVSGTSYEAEDTFLQRNVTLKQIHPWGTLPEAARRQFFREMLGISTLTHPYLAPILDYGEVDGQLYIARRYVTSGTLLGSAGRNWFHPPLDIAAAVSYARQLAEALQCIHNNGYLHGALHFANILVLRGLDADGADKEPVPFLIADVGSTHFVQRFGRPQTSLLPMTAAPEQFAKRVTAASDQYALAVILYFWLTGRPPFIGTPDEIEQLKLTETITTLTALNLKVPLELEGVIRRALSAYPEDRYPSMQAFANAIRISSTRLSPASLMTPMQNEIATESEAKQGQPPHLASIVESLEATDQQAPAPDQPAQPVPPAPPDPLPQVVPDVPQPLHEPAPDPVPLPLPEAPPEPRPEPQTDPDIVLPPAPDIPQPIPEPKPIPPAEPAKDSVAALVDEVDPATQSEQISQASVLITSPHNKKPREVILEREETSLGRAGASDILLDQDLLTSRHHALLKRCADHYEIYDLRSANGIVVNGQKIPGEIGYTLKDGDQINIGEYELTFRLKQGNMHFKQALYQA